MALIAAGGATPPGARALKWLSRVEPFYNDTAKVLMQADAFAKVKIPDSIRPNIDGQFARFCSKNFTGCPPGLSTKAALINLTGGIVDAISKAPTHTDEKVVARSYIAFLKSMEIEITSVSNHVSNMHFRGYETRTVTVGTSPAPSKTDAVCRQFPAIVATDIKPLALH